MLSITVVVSFKRFLHYLTHLTGFRVYLLLINRRKCKMYLYVESFSS